jgi:hypothetical protein
MRKTALAFAIFCLSAKMAHPTAVGPSVLSPGQQCQAAIAAAERAYAVPPQLLAAIGRVESGRKDPLTGLWGAWPWTINAEGQGAYFATKAEAIAAVEAHRARGVRSIDVGCMQVNLMHHPQAFASLDHAFEPAVNADYAARFLVRLKAQTGDWSKATASYHSANPALGEPYAAQVTAAWPEEQRKAGKTPAPAAPNPPSPGGLFAHSTPPRQPMVIPPLAQAGTGAAAPPGRGLDAYRAAPIRMSMRIPPLLQR